MAPGSGVVTTRTSSMAQAQVSTLSPMPAAVSTRIRSALASSCWSRATTASCSSALRRASSGMPAPPGRTRMPAGPSQRTSGRDRSPDSTSARLAQGLSPRSTSMLARPRSAPTTTTRRRIWLRAMPRLPARLVLPTPPLPLTMATRRARGHGAASAVCAGRGPSVASQRRSGVAWSVRIAPPERPGGHTKGCCRLDVLRNLLAGGEVGNGMGDALGERKQAAVSPDLVQLTDDEPIGLEDVEAADDLERFGQHGAQRQGEQNFARLGGGDEFAQFAEVVAVVLATAGGVDQQVVLVLVAGDELAELARVIGDVERLAEQLGIGLELGDGADAEGVGRDGAERWANLDPAGGDAANGPPEGDLVLERASVQLLLDVGEQALREGRVDAEGEQPVEGTLQGPREEHAGGKAAGEVVKLLSQVVEMARERVEPGVGQRCHGGPRRGSGG